MTSTPIELELVAGGAPKLGQSLRELRAYHGTTLAFAANRVGDLPQSS